ncbi:MAG TPA: hypothetical protein VNX86_04500 [Rhizomicrobium sp.]|jgi:hypothetical protein|nr:hypothetical protein [Rhizomicrobium sp.]
MSGSAAEERLRAKAEAHLRLAYPGARIVHELVLDQGGCRIDVAAVTPDRLVAVEVKSERDVLCRLKSQIDAAVQVAAEVWVCAAAKHEKKLLSALEEHLRELKWSEENGHKVGRYEPNPDHIPGLRAAVIFAETDDGIRTIHQPWRSDRLLDPRALLRMLWAVELRCMTAACGVGSRKTRTQSFRLALEHLTGRQIRQGVYQQIRERPFPRADAAIASERRAAPAPQQIAMALP